MDKHLWRSCVLFGGMTVALLLAAAVPALADDPGYALKFDGVSDFVKLSTTASMMPASWPTTKTVSLWVKATGSSVCTAAEPSSCDAIFGDKPRSWGISRGTIGGLDRIWVWNYDGTFDKVGVDYVVGEWVHIALVHGGGTLSAFKNGSLVGAVASGTTVQNAGQTLQIGGVINNASKNWTFEGEVDELQLWSVALTVSEISASYNHLLNGNESGLVAYYQMSDGSGTTLTDNSGHAWTGTLTDGGSGVPADGPITWVVSGAFGTSVPTNTPPVADSQSATTLEDTALGITLTGSDADGDPITFRIVAQPVNGVLSTSAGVTYTPNANFNGTDLFTFVVNDGHVDSAPATVSLTVTPVNDPPTANADSATTTVDTAVTVAVMGNDFDIDGDSFSIESVTDPANGTISYDQQGIVYTPFAGFTGSDSFTYTIWDVHGGEATATVAMTVKPAGPDPGLALRFDGASDFVRLSPTSNMMWSSWTTTKTVSLWLKPVGTPTCTIPDPAACDAIFGDRPRWWGISRGVINGQDRIWVWNYDGAERVIAIPYTVNEWVHIALVHGNGTLSAYKNGVLVGSVASGPTQQPTTGAFPVLHLGGIINSVPRNWTFQGDIDEVQIWNAARTATDIAKDMAGPLSGSETGLAAYYRMSDGSGTLLTDDSGHGWTGSLQDGGGVVPADGPILWVPSGAFAPVP